MIRYTSILFCTVGLLCTALMANLALADDDWKNLLDKDLSQWEPYVGIPHKSVKIEGREPSKSKNGTNGGEPLGLNNDPLNIFSAEMVDGEPVLKISGQIYGGLTSREEFDSYHLSLEFRWGEKKWEPRLDEIRDSGLLIHCVGEHGAFWNVWMQSLECQIQEGDCGDFIALAGTRATMPVRKKGKRSFYDAKSEVFEEVRGKVPHGPSKEKPVGEWNTIEVYAVGQKAVFLVNGTPNMAMTKTLQTVDGKLKPLTRGKLQIQSEAAEVEYRRIKIRSIKSIPEEFQPLVAGPPVAKSEVGDGEVGEEAPAKK